ncbi:MAG TPA: hypothetical protein VF898_13450 [Chloroflexota bacterium]
MDAQIDGMSKASADEIAAVLAALQMVLNGRIEAPEERWLMTARWEAVHAAHGHYTRTTRTWRKHV